LDLLLNASDPLTMSYLLKRLYDSGMMNLSAGRVSFRRALALQSALPELAPGLDCLLLLHEQNKLPAENKRANISALLYSRCRAIELLQVLNLLSGNVFTPGQNQMRYNNALLVDLIRFSGKNNTRLPVHQSELQAMTLWQNKRRKLSHSGVELETDKQDSSSNSQGYPQSGYTFSQNI
jgi:hypothetical protein